MIEAPTLVTSRLELRAWRDADQRPFAAMNADPRVMEHFPATLSDAESDAFLDRMAREWVQGFGRWAVVERATDEFIGFVGFSSPVWTASFTPCVEIGWRLAAPAWGQGYATEAAREALEWGRVHVEFPRGEVLSFTTEANTRSRRVMEKLGMTHAASDDFDHPLLEDWEHRRHVLYRWRP
jgi:ribosomal-protein-alanine N-acetyltransferase